MWDMQIASGASYMVKKRLETIARMNETVMDMEQTLTSSREKLEIRYKQQGSEEPRWDVEWYMEELSRRREEDARFCHTSIGPHRDDLTFLMNGMDIAAYGSQGQQRTAILSMKLSEMEFIRQETGEYPVLILDDIGSELDTQHTEKATGFAGGVAALPMSFRGTSAKKQPRQGGSIGGIRKECRHRFGYLPRLCMDGDRRQKPDERRKAPCADRANRASLSRCGRICRVETTCREHDILQGYCI